MEAVDYGTYTTIDRCVQAIFAIDMLLTFNTAFFQFHAHVIRTRDYDD